MKWWTNSEWYRDANLITLNIRYKYRSEVLAFIFFEISCENFKTAVVCHFLNANFIFFNEDNPLPESPEFERDGGKKENRERAPTSWKR